jgi:hypothetical protein
MISPKTIAASDSSTTPTSSLPIDGKRPELSVAHLIRPQSTERSVLFFQHPQEPDVDLGSAQIAHLALSNSILKVALSVPNLKKATGQLEGAPSEWGVLYLGSGIKAVAGEPQARLAPGLYPVKKDGSLLGEAEAAKVLAGLKGIILLDGTWSQAKTLWWRNAWLLKCRRLILVPKSKSLYGELRKEPRRECLSTIETAAEALDALGENPEVGAHLRELFSALLGNFRTVRAEKKKAGKPSRPLNPASSEER